VQAASLVHLPLESLIDPALMLLLSVICLMVLFFRTSFLSFIVVSSVGVMKVACSYNRAKTY
jgi:hypothetical protein